MILPTNGFAVNYFSFMYKTEDGDSFSSILKKFVKDNSIINAKTPTVKKIIKNNPNIKDWSKIQPDNLIELFISDDLIDMKKYAPFEEKELRRISKEVDSQKTPNYLNGFKSSVFYLGSVGVFTQKTAEIAEVNFKQNSPITLGTTFAHYPEGKLYSTSFSMYFSKLLASGNSLSNDQISIPLETGVNLFEEYRWVKKNITIYAGPDFEYFSTFNMKGIEHDQKIYVDRVGVMYLTAGIARSLNLGKEQFFLKTSISKSLYSTYRSGAPQSSINTVDSGEKYSGYKMLFYLNYKFNNKLYFHSLLKYHSMTGPSELTTFRVGVGFGYILF
jgi:hypothetical protein